MMTRFTKYHSLGNDFVLFDWTDQTEESILQCLQKPEWEATVVQLCDRHFGIGADGVLVLKNSHEDTIEMRIYNSDGSEAEICLNGIRCCAYHRYLDTRSEIIPILTRKQLTYNQIIPGTPTPQVRTCVSTVVYEQPLEVPTENTTFRGHQIYVGNPHYVVFEKTDPSWLSAHGSAIEQHELFPHKTNVEFVWQEENDSRLVYRALVYERGCGMTLACSSGAAAITKALHHFGKIQHEEKILLLMQGGALECMISDDGEVSLIGTAHRVFSGKLCDELSSSRATDERITPQ
jgi:diaminopimelate epimerase